MLAVGIARRRIVEHVVRVGIQAGHQARPRGRADRGRRVGSFKDHRVLRQRVDVWRTHQGRSCHRMRAAVAAQQVDAQLVAQKDQHVRTAVGRAARSAAKCVGHRFSPQRSPSRCPFPNRPRINPSPAGRGCRAGRYPAARDRTKRFRCRWVGTYSARTTQPARVWSTIVRFPGGPRAGGARLGRERPPLRTDARGRRRSTLRGTGVDPRAGVADGARVGHPGRADATTRSHHQEPDRHGQWKWTAGAGAAGCGAGAPRGRRGPGAGGAGPPGGRLDRAGHRDQQPPLPAGRRGRAAPAGQGLRPRPLGPAGDRVPGAGPAGRARRGRRAPGLPAR